MKLQFVLLSCFMKMQPLDSVNMHISGLCLFCYGCHLPYLRNLAHFILLFSMLSPMLFFAAMHFFYIYFNFFRINIISPFRFLFEQNIKQKWLRVAQKTAKMKLLRSLIWSSNRLLLSRKKEKASFTQCCNMHFFHMLFMI